MLPMRGIPLERRIVPASCDPRGVMHDPQRAQRFRSASSRSRMQGTFRNPSSSFASEPCVLQVSLTAHPQILYRRVHTVSSKITNARVRRATAVPGGSRREFARGRQRLWPMRDADEWLIDGVSSISSPHEAVLNTNSLDSMPNLSHGELRPRA